MQSETKTCKNCQQSFEITPDDFGFYEKIKVPPPTWCPECKTIRRLMWRNERTLYKKESTGEGGVKKSMISMYAPETDFNTYDQKYWWSDAWDPLSYGKEYDFSKPFFAQFNELLHKVPLLTLSNSNATNSEYCNVADQSKDCYLISSSYKCERDMYSNRLYTTKDSSDVHVVFRSELCYDDVSCSDNYRLMYSMNSDACTDSYFLYDCKNCNNCFGCTNLRNKNYCMFNQQYSKEEYNKKLAEMNVGSWNNIQKYRAQFQEMYNKAIHRYARILKSENVSGDNIDNAKNCHNSFDVTEGAQNCKNIHWGGIQTADAWDSGPGIGDGAELLYETMDTGLQGGNIIGGNVVYGCHDIRYALYCHGSSHLFGCISLRNKEYCILNKQYSKEEYETLVPKIIEHMNAMPYVDAKGREYRFGDYFPMEFSPYAYNESIAQDYFSITKEEALKRGYRWRSADHKQYETTLQAKDLPDDIKSVDEGILKSVIACEHAGTCGDGCSFAFKITAQELQFYKRLQIPLPHHCFNCRHVERLSKRNPMKLWKRQCSKCTKDIETSYAPDREEIVYCESCYQAEVL